MKVKCMFDTQEFKQKPNGYETGGIQKRLSQTEISISELATKLSNGCTFKPALLSGTKSVDWIQQQIFALDFDGGTTIQEQLDKCKELNILPAFGYKSFSYTEQVHKFRLVFVTDEVITDIDVRNKLQVTLIRTFDKSDEVTKDATRLFYGGKALIKCDLSNIINADDIIKRFFKSEYQSEVNELNCKMTGQKPVKDKTIKVKHETENTTKSNKDKADKKSSSIADYDLSDLHLKCVKNYDVDTLQSLIMSRFEVHERKSGYIEEDKYSSSIYPLKTLHTKCLTAKQVYDTINSINMYDFLGINTEFFKCILPEHNDNTPSAHIYTAEDGTQLYKCFGCQNNKGITLVTLITRLNKCSRTEAINFIKAVYNIELLQSEWQKEQIEILQNIKNYIFSEEFEYEYPALYKRISSKLSQLNALIDIAIRNVYDDNSYNNKPVFFCGQQELKKVFNTSSAENVSKAIGLFAILNLIEKLSENKIPEKMLNKAKHIAATAGHKKIANHYIINDFGYDLVKSEEIAVKLAENNFTLKGLSREWVLRTFGVEMANKIYPQYTFENAKGTSKKSDKRTDNIVKVIFALIDDKGYATEKDIIRLLQRKYGKTKTEIQIKRSLQEILDSYDLKRIRTDKETKEKLGIQAKGYPFIIVKGDF